MKKIMPSVIGVFFAAFVVGIVALLMSYTFEALGYVFPDNFISQMMGMVLFDIALLAWLGAFVYLARSTAQYAIAFIGFLVGLAGTLGMVGVDVMLSGQQQVAAPEWIGEALIYGFLLVACVHAILIYAYKFGDPDISSQISLGIERANILEEAMKNAESQLLAGRRELGAAIAPRLLNDVRTQLGLPYIGEVLDATAYDVNDMRQAIPVHIPAPRPMSFVERLKAAGQVLVNPQPAPMRQYQATAPAPINTPEPINTPDEKIEPVQVVKTEEVPQGDFFREPNAG